MDNYILYGNYGFTYRFDGFCDLNFSNNMALHLGDSACALKNRKQLASNLGFELSDFVFANQQHTANYYRVEQADKSRGSIDHADAIDNVDALYTFEKGIVLATFYADCTPVYFYSKKHHLIGVIHAGWQGSAKEITKKTLEHIINDYKIDPADITVHIGPAISQKHYEVTSEFVEQFSDYPTSFTHLDGKIYFDNRLVNKIQCQKLQINDIIISKECTHEESDKFFSYRRDGNTGRMLAFIYQ